MKTLTRAVKRHRPKDGQDRMADTADNSKYTVDDIIRLAAEVDDPRLADALAYVAEVLRGLSDDDDRDSV